MKGFLWWVLINHDVHSLMNSIPEQEYKDQESHDGQRKDLDEQDETTSMPTMQWNPINEEIFEESSGYHRWRPKCEESSGVE